MPREMPVQVSLFRDLEVQDLKARVERAREEVLALLEEGYDRWLIMYSGGKDSTASAVLVLEALRGTGVRPEIVYADTGLEIPTLHAQALAFLGHVEREGLARPVILKPRPEDSFWVQVVGKGYPRLTDTSAGAPTASKSAQPSAT